jgi:hypothetical protein
MVKHVMMFTMIDGKVCNSVHLKTLIKLKKWWK